MDHHPPPSPLTGLEGGNRGKTGPLSSTGLRVTSHPPNAKSGSSAGRRRAQLPPSGSHQLLSASARVAQRRVHHGLSGDCPAPAAGLAVSCRRSRRVEPVPLIAREGGGQARPAGGAAVRGAAVHRGAGLHLALPEERTCRSPHLPGVPLQKPDQVGRGAGPQTDLGPEDSGHPLQSHPAQIPQGGRRLLFLLGREQLRSVLQRLRPGLPASQAHHYARAATAHAGAHHHDAAGVSAPGDLPAFSGQHSGSKWAGLVL